MKCEICEEEFETENQLMQHKAQMHAGQSDQATMPEEKDTDDENLEEPDYKQAVNE